MNVKQNIEGILKNSGFVLLQKEDSKFFGDYFRIFCNSDIELRVSSSKSDETIDIRSVHSKSKEWFDLALVKGLLHNIECFNVHYRAEDYVAFLLVDLNLIINLFSAVNNSKTEEKLKELEKKRILQMFPQLKK